MATTPWYLFRTTMDVYSQTWSASATSGAPNAGTRAGSPSFSVACWMQPTSAADALLYGRDSTTQMYDVFLAPLTTAGATWDTSPADYQVIDGVRYKAMGKPKDLVLMGVVKVLTVMRDTN